MRAKVFSQCYTNGLCLYGRCIRKSKLQIACLQAEQAKNVM